MAHGSESLHPTRFREVARAGEVPRRAAVLLTAFLGAVLVVAAVFLAFAVFVGVAFRLRTFFALAFRLPPAALGGVPSGNILGSIVKEMWGANLVAVGA